MDQYRNIDGTYTSPRNGKIYKSEKAFRAHWYFKASESQGNWQKANDTKIECQFCREEISSSNIRRHEDSCYMNPKNIRACLECGKPIKKYNNTQGTCSHSCSNRYFRKRRNKPERYTQYTTICWEYHEKKCVICGEEKIVAVHHYDEDHDNDEPQNLIPLCPTHHQYVHSRYRDEVIGKIDEYIADWKRVRSLAKPGIASALGAEDRRFESCNSENII